MSQASRGIFELFPLRTKSQIQRKTGLRDAPFLIQDPINLETQAEI